MKRLSFIAAILVMTFLLSACSNSQKIVSDSGISRSVLPSSKGSVSATPSITSSSVTPPTNSPSEISTIQQTLSSGVTINAKVSIPANVDFSALKSYQGILQRLDIDTVKDDLLGADTEVQETREENRNSRFSDAEYILLETPDGGFISSTGDMLSYSSASKADVAFYLRLEPCAEYNGDAFLTDREFSFGTRQECFEKVKSLIGKGILEISQKEEPFDVFICYKETDNNGRRTQDSVLANDLYHQLTQEGFKVFFSRITLEDKLGTAYEPYIFAALNSAKVMVVLGTRPEYFNAVWVKNEWSRFLALIKDGAKKVLIPAYKDMDPYDLPEEFSHLQAQDMSKLGFMQDLIRGIKKIADTDPSVEKGKETTVVPSSNAAVEPLLKRAFMFLEDGEWESADEYCERVLDMDPENARAYLGKLMAELEIRSQDDFISCHCRAPFRENNNFRKAVRFSSPDLRDQLEAAAESADKLYILHTKLLQIIKGRFKSLREENSRRLEVEFERLAKEREEERVREEKRRKEETKLRIEEMRQQKIATLKSEKQSLEAELANLRGLFTGRRRKEIETRIGQISEEIRHL